MKKYYIYILASKKNGTLYIGVTSDLCRRVHEHKQKREKSFTEKYKVSKLVYFEFSGDVESALQREKTLKRYLRSWKIDLIEKDNPEWLDLFTELCPGYSDQVRV